MARKESFAEIINSAKVMLSGLKSNTERMDKRGLNAEFISKLEALQQSAMTLDNEQEDLKAKLKTKTEALESQTESLNKMMSEAKKVIKLEMEKSTWKSFGIQDSK